MKVLDTLIGLRGLKTEGGEEIKPASGKYVNDLPGMASEMFSDIANADQADAAGVWRTVLARSKDLFTEMVAAAIETDKRFTRSLFRTEGVELARQPEGYSGPDYAGVYLFIPESKLTDLFIKSIWLQTPEPVIGAKLVIYDLNSGEPVKLLSKGGADVLAEQDIDLTAGLNEIPLNAFTVTPFKDIQLFIAVKGAALAWLQIPNLGDRRFNYLGVVSDTAGRIDFNGPYSESIAALMVEATAECSLEKYVTRNVERFTTAWQYLVAAETLREKIHSPRVNFWSSGNIALSEENLNYFVSQARRSVAAAVAKTPVSDFCGCDIDRAAITYTDAFL